MPDLQPGQPGKPDRPAQTGEPVEWPSPPDPYAPAPVAQGEPFQSPPARGYRRGAARVAGRGSERALAVTAHAAIGFGFLGIGFLLALLISGVIWLVGRKSPYVEAHGDRAGRYQLFILLTNLLVVALWASGLGVFIYLGGWGGWAAGGWRALLWALLGLALLVAVPVFLAWYVATIVYGLYAALRVLAGDDFRYPWHPLSRRGDTRVRRSARATAADDPLERPLQWER